MYIELTTGNDSFRAQGSSLRRNTGVTSFVRVSDDGEGNNVIPLFAAYQKKLRGFKETQLIAAIPATANFTANTAGQWFRNRHEVAPRTEILLEHRRRGTSGFAEQIEHLMLIADANAPLYQLRLELPPHHIAAVPHVFFEGRFEIVRSDDQLTEHAVNIWRDYLSLDKEFAVSDILDPNQDERFWREIELEAAVRSEKKLIITEKEDGTKKLKIRRTRRIRY